MARLEKMCHLLLQCLHHSLVAGAMRTERFFTTTIAFSPRNNVYIHTQNAVVRGSARSIHSEPYALQQMHRRGIHSDIHIIVFCFLTSECRDYMKTGILPIGKLAKPCSACAKCLRCANVASVHFSNGQNMFEKLQTSTTCAPSRGDKNRR